jgi:hypothetical protein
MTRTRAFASLLAATLFVGCSAKKQTTLAPPPPEPNPQPQLATDARQRAQTLQSLVDQYAASAAKLPGSNEQQDRQQVSDQFGLLAQILPLLNGPDQPGDFAQQMRIIESSRSQLASGSMDLSSEPTVDTGLRAAQRALSSLQRRMFSDHAEISGQIDAMRATVQELDTVSGPIHRQVAAESFQRSADAIKSMSQALNQRFAEGAGGNKPAAPETPAPAAATPPKPEQPTTPAPAQTATPPKPEQPKAETPAQPKPEQPVTPPTPKPEPAKPAQPPLPELNK